MTTGHDGGRDDRSLHFWSLPQSRLRSTAPSSEGAKVDRKFCLYQSLSSLRTAMKASVGTCTVPRFRIFFLPSFCFSSSFFLRVMSPP